MSQLRVIWKRKSKISITMSLFEGKCFYYKPRFIQSKGAVLVLFWNLASFLLITYPSDLVHGRFTLWLYFIFSLTFPVIGYLSDVWVGRYKVIRYSMWIVFVSLIVSNVLEEIESLMLAPQYVVVLKQIIAGVRALGAVGVLSNSAQFGIDQLVDSSSSNITSYISWYVWTVYFSSFINAVMQKCFYGVYNKSTAFFLMPLVFAIAIATDFLMSHWLIVEPVTSNPFKLIFQVLRYAAKNKYPRLRSAFTYWEDKPYSRIDLAKAKYGGPFTTEQVEDVKTFFQLLPTILFFCLLAGEVFIISSPYKYVQHSSVDKISHNREGFTTKYFRDCYKITFLQYIQTELIFFFVPTFEFLIYPLLPNCRVCNKVGILKKLFFGAVLVFASELSLLASETASVLSNNPNKNSTCQFDPDNWTLVSRPLLNNYALVLFSQLMSGLATYILFTSTFEFVSAQSPYSMRGLLVGTIFTTAIISVSISYGFIKLFRIVTKTSDWKCGIWYYLVNTGYTIIIIGLLVSTNHWYTYRKRDEMLGNDQVFAVNYFTKYLNSQASTKNRQLKPID